MRSQGGALATAPVSLAAPEATHLPDDLNLLQVAVDLERHDLTRDPAMDGRSNPLCVRDQLSRGGLCS